MLTTSQTVLVGAVTPEGEVICAECLKVHIEAEEGLEHTPDLGEARDWLAKGKQHNAQWYAVIEYTLHAEYNSDGVGVDCNWCGESMAEAYCTECGDTDVELKYYGGRALCASCARKEGLHE